MKPKVKASSVFGRTELRAWFEAEMFPDGSMKLTGMGSRIDYDRDGKVTGFKIEPTGESMIWPAPEEKTWIQKFLGI